jgi:ammonia channel protein AmtB
LSRLEVSRRLAYFFGAATPIAETVRRWGTLWDNPPAFLDDYLLGAFLLAGAWATRRRGSARAVSLLAAAWGFASGMAYSSAAFHWFVMRAGQLDPSGLPSQWVFAIKVSGGLIFITALALTVTASDPRHSSPTQSQAS